MGIEIEVSHDVDDEIIQVELKQNIAGVIFSVEVDERISVINTNELDCAIVEVGIKFDVSNEVDDEMNMNDFSTWIHNFARVMLKQDQLSVMVSQCIKTYLVQLVFTVIYVVLC